MDFRSVVGLAGQPPSRAALIDSWGRFLADGKRTFFPLADSCFCGYNNPRKRRFDPRPVYEVRGMARPPKDPSERKDFDLRIPVTADQKELILQAAKLEGADMAAWVRPILLEAAEQLLFKRKAEEE